MAGLMMDVIPLVLVAIVGQVTCHFTYHVCDLTHTRSPNTLYWLGNETYTITSLSRGQNAKGYWYESSAYITAEHADVHLEHPADFSKGLKRKQFIPMKHLIGPGVIINVKTKVANNTDYRVTIDDLNAWESKYKKIPAGSVVLMNSGCAANYKNKALTFGTKTPDDPSSSTSRAGTKMQLIGWLKIDRSTWLVWTRLLQIMANR